MPQATSSLLNYRFALKIQGGHKGREIDEIETALAGGYGFV
jgi:hypothetical protein